MSNHNHVFMNDDSENEENDARTTPVRSAGKLHSSPTQLKISDAFKKSSNYAPGSEKKVFLDNLLMKMLAKGMFPMSCVENDGFKSFITALDRRYTLPSRSHLRDTLLPKIFREVQDGVRTRTTKAVSIALTTDMWTNINFASFISVTAHFIEVVFVTKHCI